MKIFYIVAGASLIWLTAWSQSNGPSVGPVPDASPQAAVTNLPGNPVTLPPATNTVMVVETNSLPKALRIDTSGLVKAFTGTDAITKEKVSIAIGAIRTGDYGVARENLGQVLAMTAMTPDQEKEIRGVINQIPTP